MNKVLVMLAFVVWASLSVLVKTPPGVGSKVAVVSISGFPAKTNIELVAVGFDKTQINPNR